HLTRVAANATRTLERHPNFLRLLVAFSAQPSAAASEEVRAVVGRVRELALRRLRTQVALAFDDDPRSATTDQLARFALAAFDGAFVASQADPTVRLERLLKPLGAALVGARRALLAKR